MIVKPIIIVGCPRSGTSLIQKMIRDHEGFWSLPSEGGMIWEQYCHPEFRNWESDYCNETMVSAEDREEIRKKFEVYSMPAFFWRIVERKDIIWNNTPNKSKNAFMRHIYNKVLPFLKMYPFTSKFRFRLIEKTVNNCFRIGLVNDIFPDARFIYIFRDGKSNINSLIEGWRNPKRFFSYELPEEIQIAGYSFKKWNFVLPIGWQKYVNSSLEEVCAFQWVSCNETILNEFKNEKYAGRVYKIRLEELISDKIRILKDLSNFIEVPFDRHFKQLTESLPMVNSKDGNTDIEKWKKQNKRMIENIFPMIESTMNRLGYKLY